VAPLDSKVILSAAGVSGSGGFTAGTFGKHCWNSSADAISAGVLWLTLALPSALVIIVTAPQENTTLLSVENKVKVRALAIHFVIDNIIQI
jgi:hypothetical protein